ncbi:GNAT family N-acetyltransferase [Phaeobacter sp. C3_T13_0]|uniref:GNAT family N-acetyltransferase n=1 Tax=Phaeobacter cretensis TaxID=3342641 RepID=UPI0039BD144A
MIELMAEQPADRWEVEALYDLCFAPGREALSSYRLREAVPPVSGLSQVARDEGGILAGAIRFWPVRVGEAADPALLLGPVAVHPTHQGEGLGGALIRDSLAKAAEAGWSRVLLVGDAPYYRRFGFAPLRAVDMPPPTNPDRVLGLDLVADGWADVHGQILSWRGPQQPG